MTESRRTEATPATRGGLAEWQKLALWATVLGSSVTMIDM